jgi:hypothetical protein
MIERRARGTRLVRERAYEVDAALMERQQGVVLHRDERQLTGGPCCLGFSDKLRSVKRIEKRAQSVVRLERLAEQPLEALVGTQHVDVVDAVAACRHQQDQRLDFLRVGCAAVSQANSESLVQRLREPEHPHRLEHQR